MQTIALTSVGGNAEIMQHAKLYQHAKTIAAALGFRTRRGETKGWERFARASDGNPELLAQSGNDMERAFYSHNDRVAHKWHDYLWPYDRAASRYRGTSANFLEIGVCHGGSLQVWKDYLGPEATINGIDILSICREVEEEQIHVFQCDTRSREELIQALKRIGPLDIVVDDGSHIGSHQRICFEEIFPRMRDGGVYIVEDIQCSYWRDFQGGYKRSGSFVEYCKDLIDRIHIWYISDDRIGSDEWFARNIRSISFSDGIVVIEKGPKNEPFHVRAGWRALPLEAEVEKLKSEGRWLVE